MNEEKKEKALSGGVYIDIHDNGDITVNPNLTEMTITNNYYQGKTKEAETNKGRLPLFVTDKEKLDTLVSDLAVCETTADVCRAVAKLSGGKIPNDYKLKTFAEALLPILRFKTTENAIYQALYNFT